MRSIRPSAVPPTLEKTCFTCKISKLAQDFTPQKNGSGGLTSSCKACRNAAYRRLYEMDEEFREASQTRHKLKTYGITREQYNALLTAQKGRCAICRQKPRARKGLTVDHDHDSGVIRGLLCPQCNMGIGLLGEDIKILRGAIAYLKAWGK